MVSKKPVAKSAPAAKETSEKEILCINFSFASKIATRKSDTIEAKKVKNKIFNNIIISGNLRRVRKIPANGFQP